MARVSLVREKTLIYISRIRSNPLNALPPLIWRHYSTAVESHSNDVDVRLPHMTPDAEISFDPDQEQDRNEFIRFNPLPSKWAKARNSRRILSVQERLTGHKLSVDEVYTGRAKNTIPSIQYYSEVAESESTAVENGELFQVISKYIFGSNVDKDRFACFIGSECYRVSILPGDLIELCSRDGQVVFGLVLSTNDTSAKLLSVDGNISNVRLRKSSHSYSRNISIVLRGLFARSHVQRLTDIDETKSFVYFMKQFITRTFKIMPSLSAYLQPVYAYLAQPNTIQATNLEYMTNNLLLASRNALKNQLDSSPLSQLSLIFAIYLSSCGNNLRFARLSVDSPIIALSENSFDAVVKIMHYLTDQELNSYVNIFQQLLVRDEHIKHTPTGIAPILALFNHYILCPDPRLSDAIRSILSKIYPDRDSDVWLSSPSSVHKLLCDCGLADKNDPFFPSLGAQNLSDLNEKFKYDFKRKGRPKGLFDNTTQWKREYGLPVYKIVGIDDVLFSIDENHGKFYIHIPDITSILSIDEPAVKVLFKIGKSWNSPDKQVSLFPPEFMKKKLNYWTFVATGDNLNDCEIFQTSISKDCLIGIKGTSESQDGVAHLLRNNPALSRRDSLNLKSISTFLEQHFWKRIENGSIFDIPLSARTYSTENSRPILGFTISDMIQESRLLAGMITAQIGRKNSFPLPYIGQNLRDEQETKHIPEERKLTGNLSANNKILAESYLSEEIISNEPIPYTGLGIPRGYVHIANPFDDTLSLCSQWSLKEHLQKNALDQPNDDMTSIFNRNVLYKNRSHSLKQITNEVLVQRDLVDHLHEKLFRFASLHRLEEELRASKNYYIFRCQIVEEADFPEMAVAYCNELQLLVDIALLPDTSVAKGDTILCTEIIELNPVDGLLVLGY